LAARKAKHYLVHLKYGVVEVLRAKCTSQGTPALVCKLRDKTEKLLLADGQYFEEASAVDGLYRELIPVALKAEANALAKERLRDARHDKLSLEKQTQAASTTAFTLSDELVQL